MISMVVMAGRPVGDDGSDFVVAMAEMGYGGNLDGFPARKKSVPGPS